MFNDAAAIQEDQQVITVGHSRLEGASLLVERDSVGRWPIASHRLAFHKLTVVVSGEGILETANGPVQLRPGCLFLTQPLVAHTYPQQTGRLDIIQALFDARALFPRFPELLEASPEVRTLLQRHPRHVTQAAPVMFKMRPERVGLIARNMAALYEMGRANPPLPEPMNQARLLVILADAIQLDQEAGGDTGRAYSSKINHVIQLMTTRYAETVRLAELADAVDWNEAYLSRRFKKETGLTPVEHLNRVRIERACHKLLATRQSIAEIAGATGFNEIPYFNRVFKRLVGKTPTAYRFKKGSINSGK